MRQPGDIDTSRVDNIDRVFLAQLCNLLLGQTCNTEHATLLYDWREILFKTLFLKGLDQQMAHLVDPVANIGDFLDPPGFEFFVAQYGGHNLPAMRGWIRIVVADAKLNLAHDRSSLISAIGNHCQGSGSFAVEAKVFREARTDEHLFDFLGQFEQPGAVLLYAGA